MEIINCRINDILPYENNAKKHSDEQVKKIADSIEAFGFNQPLVLDKDNVIIVGHGRYLAAKKLNLSVVPVLIVDISKEKAKAYRLADNKLNESEWDMALVIDELKELSLDMVELTGFSKEITLEPDERDNSTPENAPESGGLLSEQTLFCLRYFMLSILCLTLCFLLLLSQVLGLRLCIDSSRTCFLFLAPMRY